MHVLAIEDRPTAFAGGQERSLFEVCEGLARRGHRVSLAYREPGDLLAAYRGFGADAVELPSRVLRVGRLPRFTVDLLRGALHRRRAGWSLIYANQYFDLPFATALGMLTGTPVVCHLRLAAPHYLSRQYRFGLMRAAALIANSRFTAASYRAAGIPAARLRVVHNGVDASRYPVSPAPSEATTRLAYLGRIAPGKGLEVLIDAVRALHDRGRALRLSVHGALRGDAIPAGYAADLAARCGPLLDTVISLSPPVADPREVLARSDLVVVPSHCGEAFGRTVIEAMACGLPVVASDDGGIGEILRPAFPDHLVTPADAQGLAAAIDRLAGWRRDDPALGERGRRWVSEHFALSRNLDAIEAVLDGALRGLPAVGLEAAP